MRTRTYNPPSGGCGKRLEKNDWNFRFDCCNGNVTGFETVGDWKCGEDKGTFVKFCADCALRLGIVW